MAKVIVGGRTYAWGPDAAGLIEDPNSEGPIVLSVESVKPVLAALDEIGWDALRPPRMFEVFFVQGTAFRRVVVGETLFQLTAWQRPVAGDVPSDKPAEKSEAVMELEACLEVIQQQHALAGPKELAGFLKEVLLDPPPPTAPPSEMFAEEFNEAPPKPEEA